MMKKAIIILVTMSTVAVMIMMWTRVSASDIPARAVGSTQAVDYEPVVPKPRLEMASPKRFKISSLGIDAPIVPVGLTDKGDMATPSDELTLGWYGVMPGQPGNAVLAGHTGYPDRPSSFRKFEQLKITDVVEIEDDMGAAAFFEIIQTAIYTPDTAPRHMIFGPSTTERLTLVTCTGTWLPAEKTYSHRLVIYAVRRD